MNLEQMIKLLLNHGESGEPKNNCSCLVCTLVRKKEVLEKTPQATVKQIEDANHDAGAAFKTREIAYGVDSYKVEMYDRAAMAARENGYPVLGKAFGALAECGKAIGALREAIAEERETHEREAAEAVNAEGVEETAGKN